MGVSDTEVEQIARRMLAELGCRAAIIAAERLNECIDHQDWNGRDTFARVVCRIHALLPKDDRRLLTF
jgi:hypothetical protein